MTTATTTATTHVHILAAARNPTNFPPSRTNFLLAFPKTTPFHYNLETVASPRTLEIVSSSVKAAKGNNPTGEQKFTYEGSITESLPNGMFRVQLDNQDLIIGYISGKIRQNFVRILPGDRVRVEVSRYDSSRGRIIYRIRNVRDSANN